MPNWSSAHVQWYMIVYISLSRTRFRIYYNVHTAELPPFCIVCFCIYQCIYCLSIVSCELNFELNQHQSVVV